MSDTAAGNKHLHAPDRPLTRLSLGGDAFACAVIAPTSLAVALMLAAWAWTLAPGAGVPFMAVALIWFWAATFALIALRATSVIIREMISR